MEKYSKLFSKFHIFLESNPCMRWGDRQPARRTTNRTMILSWHIDNTAMSLGQRIRHHLLWKDTISVVKYVVATPFEVVAAVDEDMAGGGTAVASCDVMFHRLRQEISNIVNW